VAITFRRRRAAAAWAPHLAASKAVILEAAGRCAGHRRALVIGAGDCADVPVPELAARFDEVVLTDVVLGPEMQKQASRSGGRVRAEIWDATGALATLARDWRTLKPVQVEALFESADPGPPSGGEPNLVVSANCISQLGVVPLDRFPGVEEDDLLQTRSGAAAARCHLRWLAARRGVRVLLGDRARLDLAADNRELRREPVPGMEALRAPDRTWRWSLAPIPELSRDFHRVHEVGAWIDGPDSSV
jgi:hypothetical protein